MINGVESISKIVDFTDLQKGALENFLSRRGKSPNACKMQHRAVTPIAVYVGCYERDLIVDNIDTAGISLAILFETLTGKKNPAEVDFCPVSLVLLALEDQVIGLIKNPQSFTQNEMRQFLADARQHAETVVESITTSAYAVHAIVDRELRQFLKACDPSIESCAQLDSASLGTIVLFPHVFVEHLACQWTYTSHFDEGILDKCWLYTHLH
jgi:hypothetical protein